MTANFFSATHAPAMSRGLPSTPKTCISAISTASAGDPPRRRASSSKFRPQHAAPIRGHGGIGPYRRNGQAGKKAAYNGDRRAERTHGYASLPDRSVVSDSEAATLGAPVPSRVVLGLGPVCRSRARAICARSVVSDSAAIEKGSTRHPRRKQRRPSLAVGRATRRRDGIKQCGSRFGLESPLALQSRITRHRQCRTGHEGLAGRGNSPRAA